MHTFICMREDSQQVSAIKFSIRYISYNSYVETLIQTMLKIVKTLFSGGNLFTIFILVLVSTHGTKSRLGA